MKGKLLAMALLAVPLVGCGSSEQAASPAAAAGGTRLTLAQSDAAAWQDVSAEVGTVDEAQVLARIPGVLTSLTVREGDLVGKGQGFSHGDAPARKRSGRGRRRGRAD